MNAVVLAGGFAKRLWPLTQQFPKCLLVVGGKPVLTHLLENLASVAGLTRVVVAIDDNQQAFFEKYLKEASLVTAITPSISAHTSGPDGAITGPIQKLYELYLNRNKLNLNDDRWLVIGADNVFGFAINNFAKATKKRFPKLYCYT